MRLLLFLVVHAFTTLARLLGPGGIKAVLAENLLIKQQLLVIDRSRHRAPVLLPMDRIFMDLLSLFMNPGAYLRLRKLNTFKNYYNDRRVHASLDGKIPDQISTGASCIPA